VAKKILLAVLVTFVFGLGSVCAEGLSAEELFNQAKAKGWEEREAAQGMYTKLLATYPDSPYTPHALMELLQMNSYLGDIINAIPFFRFINYDFAKIPLSLSLTGTAALTSITEIPQETNLLQYAEKLYNEHREFLETQGAFVWCCIYSAGLEEESIPYLVKAVTDQPYVSAAVLSRVASYFYKKGDLDIVLDLIEIHLQGSDPKYEVFLPFVYLMKALLLLDQDKVQPAIEAASQADAIIKRHPDMTYLEGMAKFTTWFLPKDQVSGMKVGVFVDGKPQENIVVAIGVPGGRLYEDNIIKEARKTKSEGYTGTFLRAPGHYEATVYLTPEQGLPLDYGKFTIIVKGKDGAQVVSYFDRNNIIKPGEIFSSHTHAPYIDLKPGEEILVEYHIKTQNFLEIAVASDRTTYNAEDVIRLTWDEVPGTAFYRLKILGEKQRHYIDLTHNSISLDEKTVNEMWGPYRVQFTYSDEIAYLTPSSILGAWRGLDTLTFQVIPYNSVEETKDQVEIMFPTFHKEVLPRQAIQLTQCTINKDSLRPWEREIVNLSVLEAYPYFLKMCMPEEIAQDLNLQQMQQRLKMSYNSIWSSAYRGEEIFEARSKAKELIEAEDYVAAEKIYEKLLVSDKERVYLEAFLCDLTTVGQRLGSKFYVQLAKDPDFDIINDYRWHDDFNLEQELLPQIAKALLKGDFQTAECFLSQAEENSVLYNRIKALLALATKYKIFED